MQPRGVLIWVALIGIVTTSVAAAALSPLLQWRDPIYIIAGFAGVIALALMLFQPLLVIGFLPGLGGGRGRSMHRFVGAVLAMMVVFHVAGLWITSPPDVIDVLLFRSPTPFSIWGALAMWAVFGAALLATIKKRLSLRFWRMGHTVLVAFAVIGTVIHALRIDGTMGDVTKVVLCFAVVAAFIKAIGTRRVWVMRRTR